MKHANEIFEELRKPFHPDDIEWRIGMKSKDRTKASVLAYMNARAVMDRLDEVCGAENWEVSYRELDLGTVNEKVLRWENGQHVEKDNTKVLKGFLCTISIRCLSDENEVITITRSDGANCTDFEAIKGGLSGALKRAASAFGIGRYLYNLKETWVPINQYGKFETPQLPTWALPEGFEYPQKQYNNNNNVNNQYQSQDNSNYAPSNEEWSEVPEPTPFDGDDSEPVMTSGKYQGTKVKDIQDKGYLAWIVEKSKFSPAIKQAAKGALTA